ncbi:MAG: photosystem II protein Psb27 [Snowella sp.]|jgi:photosystem II Psb27 protein|nr:MAG: photosystem II protein Psb27 [Snowella sp.]
MSLKNYWSRLLALVLVAVIGLTGCNSSTGLTGNYSQDTLTVIETLTTALDLPSDAPDLAAIQTTAREQINDYISRYRRETKSGGLRSFTTMQTALNSLAGYYTAYGSRPIPEKLKNRLKIEFKQAKVAVERGV